MYTTPDGKDLGRRHAVGLCSVKMTCLVHSKAVSRGLVCQCWVSVNTSLKIPEIVAETEKWLVAGQDMNFDAHEEASLAVRRHYGMNVKGPRKGSLLNMLDRAVTCEHCEQCRLENQPDLFTPPACFLRLHFVHV